MPKQYMVRLLDSAKVFPDSADMEQAEISQGMGNTFHPRGREREGALAAGATFGVPGGSPPNRFQHAPVLSYFGAF